MIGQRYLQNARLSLKIKRERDAAGIVKDVADEEQPEYDALEVRELHQEQGGDERRREREHHIAQRAQLFFAGLLAAL